MREFKSLVDIQLPAHACQEYYQNHIDSFVLVSSDSDYWGRIKSLSEARFLVMVDYCYEDSEKKYITEEEKASYFSDVIDFEWNRMEN